MTEPVTSPSLETLLEQAAAEPGYRPAFFKALLDASVWVPGRATQSANNDGELELEHWEKEDGGSIIAFFTSPEALEQAVAKEQAFVVMPVRELFAMTLGETLFLNAGLPTGKEFTPREIEHLLHHESSPVSQHIVMEGEETLLLSEVTNPPAQMISSLTALFASVNTVKRAWICSFKERADDKPGWLIGIEAVGDVESIIHAAGGVATDTLPGEEPIDICLISNNEPGISHFMTTHLTPFYERRWGSFLRDLKTQRII